MCQANSTRGRRSDSVAQDAPGSDDTSEAKTGSPWSDIAARVDELREFASYFAEANFDRLRLLARATALWMILAITACVVIFTLVIVASALLVLSLASAAAEMMGGRIWLGQLVVSCSLLAIVGGGLWLAGRALLRKYHQQIVDKYETRKQRERTEHGTDVEERARERSPTR